MSYLQRPRLHFFGRFETDVSTVNNLAQNFDEGTFTEQDAARTRDGSRGSWNPTGSGTWRLVGCSVTSAWRRSDAAPADDPVLAMQLADGGDRVPAKLVDLDPDQQMVSQIWGLRVRLMTADGDVALGGRFVAAPFTDLWPRLQGWQQAGIGSGAMSAFYQSELRDVTWGALTETSPFLRELRDAAGDGPLSMRFVVDHYDADFTSKTFRLGRLSGSLGVASPREPQHFVRGRQLFSAQMGALGTGFPFVPPATFANAVAVVDRTAGKVIVDLGNAVPTQLPDYAIVTGRVMLGTGSAASFQSLGEIAYDTAWYQRTAGVVELPADRTLTAAEIDALEQTPLVLVASGDSNGTTGGAGNTIVAAEAASGEHVRADDFVLRLSPGDDVRVPLYATRFGRPLPSTSVTVQFDNSPLGNAQGDPPTGVPEEALRPAKGALFPTTLPTDSDGIAWLTFVAGAPGHRRVYLDGQVYGVRPLLAAQAAGTAPVNPSDFISVLLFDDVEMPDEPTWYVHVRPILRQYANLYPIMRQVLDLDQYESVVAHKEMLELVFSLPVEDPNYMPVTRDLSPRKRALLLRWLTAAGEPALGHEPPLGSVPPPPPVPVTPQPAATAASGAAQRASAALPADGSKADFLRRTARYGGKG